MKKQQRQDLLSYRKRTKLKKDSVISTNMKKFQEWKLLGLAKWSVTPSNITNRQAREHNLMQLM